MVAMESKRELVRDDAAPEFSLQGTDGATYTLDSFADNEALLLVFTCNHCPYAKAKLPALNAMAEDYDDVAVVGINPNVAEEYPEDSYERMCELVDDGTVRYDAYLRDESQEAARSYGATCTPDPFLFRRNESEDARGSLEGGEAQTGWKLAYHGRLDDALNPDDEPSKEPGFEMRQAIEAVLAGDELDDDFRPSRGCSIKWTEE
jgi:peroxiredoxin